VKIGIYNEPPGGSVGGSEISVAVLAEALKERHEVEIIHHKEFLTLKLLAEISGANLDTVRMRRVEHEPHSFGNSHNPFNRYRQASAWNAALSEPYDLFINFTHGFPPFCRAPRGVLMILFPLDEPPHVQMRGRSYPPGPWNSSRRIKHLYHAWEWKRRLESYQVTLANSQFTRAWAKRRWEVDCEVIYPPVDIGPCSGEKSAIILSVGRFTTTGHSKKQLEMLAAFKQLDDESLSGWQYVCAGGVSGSPEDREYFAEAQRMADKPRTRVLANVERGQLKRLYEGAKIFWHAAGYDEDEVQRPELTEHFGMATVEAMAAGCVPIVTNKGGQPEIIRHQVNGFLWNRLEELKEYTRLVARDERLRSQMADAARVRSRDFSREEYVKQFLRVLSLK
jgi:glycosyltransferase involved in cell wall biosynthesis